MKKKKKKVKSGLNRIFNNRRPFKKPWMLITNYRAKELGVGSLLFWNIIKIA